MNIKKYLSLFTVKKDQKPSHSGQKKPKPPKYLTKLEQIPQLNETERRDLEKVNDQFVSEPMIIINHL